MSLTSYIFKPKHGAEVSKKIIEAFCSDYLGFGMEGLYLWWRENPPSGPLPIPEGYVEFHVDQEGAIEYFSEACYSCEELTASQLAEDLYILPVMISGTQTMSLVGIYIPLRTESFPKLLRHCAHPVAEWLVSGQAVKYTRSMLIRTGNVHENTLTCLTMP